MTSWACLEKPQCGGLSQCCEEETERKILQLIAGKDKLSKSIWANFVEGQGLGVADLLHLFPSCKPSLRQLVNILVPMPPRYYSITSSPLNYPDAVSIAFSVVRNQLKSSSAVVRRVGVCTSFLEHLLVPLLFPNHYLTHLFRQIY